MSALQKNDPQENGCVLWNVPLSRIGLWMGKGKKYDMELPVVSVTYLFTCQAKSGKAPIGIIMPEATLMSLHQILNDPISWLPSVTQVADLSRCAVDGNEIAGK